MVDHRTDFESQLKFLTECRGKFSHLESVQISLIHCANKLATDTRKRMAGKITNRGKGFLQVQIRTFHMCQGFLVLWLS